MRDAPFANRKDLLREIISHGIAHSTPSSPIRSRHGDEGISWVMSFLGVGLREPWLSQACDLVLEKLDDFQSRQIATMGFAGSSLVTGCVLRSGGRYSGMMVRPEAKAYGSAKQIEGLGDPARPVVIVDDAIGSGHSALRCATILEEAGYEVEGIVSLVRFTYNSGYAIIEESGLPVRHIYDLNDDFLPLMTPEQVPDPAPWRASDIRWSDEAAPEGLGAVALARHYLYSALSCGALPRPPRRLSTEPDSPGGLWVSLRQYDTGIPVARNGVWRFPDEADPGFSRLLAEACWKVAQTLPRRPADLEQCGIGLSLIGALEPCAPGAADEAAYGILCRSLERPWQTGSALPNVPGMSGAAHQLQHAAFSNGQFRPFEPWDTWRFTVGKLEEPGAVRPDGGASARPYPDPEGRDAMVARILARLRAVLTGNPVETGDDLHFFDADYLFVTIRADDRDRACLGSPCRTVADLDALVRQAATDPRMRGVDLDAAHLSLTILTDRWTEAGTPAFLPGRDALGLRVAGSEAVLLPSVAVEENLDATPFADLLHAKSGASGDDPLEWSRFRVLHWCEGQARPTHPSPWVASRRCAPGIKTAQGWFHWLRSTIEHLPESVDPVQGIHGEAASPALYAESWRWLREAADVLTRARIALPFDLLPRNPDLPTLSHAVAGLGDEAPAAMAQRLDAMVRQTLPRHDPAGYWRAVEALGRPGERAERWRKAPLSPCHRVVRLCATDDEAEAAWLCGLVRDTGEVVSPDSAVEDTLFTARAAEALAGSARAAERKVAARILDHLMTRSVWLDAESAAIRMTEHRSRLQTEHTVAALGAWVRLTRAQG